ncbi:MAG TPA: sensor histidine kinase [Propionibacteriaceae bacterium]|nr:sensor histidine kinase [Propionibacteriaceae bacterium]
METTAATPQAARALTVVQHLLFCLLYVVAVGNTWNNGGLTWGIALGSVVFAGWYVFGVVLERRSHDLRVGIVWVLMLIGIWGLLVVAGIDFVWLAFPLIMLTMLIVPFVVGVTISAGVTATVLIRLVSESETSMGMMMGPVIGALIAMGMASVTKSLIAETKSRGTLLDELTRAHAETLSMSRDLARVQREAGASEERARIARDIHDTLAQGFSSIVLLSRAAQTARPDDVVLSQIEQTAHDNLEEARRVVRALAPAPLDETPLSGALGRLVGQLAAETGVRATFDVEGTPAPIPTAVEVELLRLAQGALANVRSHAQASRVGVTLTCEPTEVRLDVVDDGVGFDATDPRPADPNAGFGLRSMRERVALLGGTLVVESVSGEGTAISVAVPLASSAPGEPVAGDIS